MNSVWLQPSEESYYVAQLWKDRNIKRVWILVADWADIQYFCKTGFSVSAFDLSLEATEYLKAWAERENLSIEVINADMMKISYEDNFDAILHIMLYLIPILRGLKK